MNTQYSFYANQKICSIYDMLIIRKGFLISDMKATGIIAEYNPFHKGHACHIAKTREITGADCVIVVMSGNFVQRGEPAIMDKYARARAALLNGADIVIELASVSAVGSAQYFAAGGVGILKNMQADALCFGSESGDITPFLTASSLLLNRKSELDPLIHKYVKGGSSYPLARSRAIQQDSESTALLSDTKQPVDLAELSNLFCLPNNILGLEYCMEIILQNAAITPFTIKRTDSGYHDTTLHGQFASASAIRNAINANNAAFLDFLPENTHDFIKEYFNCYPPVFINDFSDMIRFELMKMNDMVFDQNQKSSRVADLPEFLQNKLLSHVKDAFSVTQLIEAVKSKDLTYTRISRALLHLLLGITERDYHTLKENPCPYIRVLGLNKTGQAYLAGIKKSLTCPLIVKPADYKEYLSKDIFASDIYNLVLSRKSGCKTVSDYRREIIKEQSI